MAPQPRAQASAPSPGSLVAQAHRYTPQSQRTTVKKSAPQTPGEAPKPPQAASFCAEILRCVDAFVPWPQSGGKLQQVDDGRPSPQCVAYRSTQTRATRRIANSPLPKPTVQLSLSNRAHRRRTRPCRNGLLVARRAIRSASSRFRPGPHFRQRRSTDQPKTPVDRRYARSQQHPTRRRKYAPRGAVD